MDSPQRRADGWDEFVCGGAATHKFIPGLSNRLSPPSTHATFITPTSNKHPQNVMSQEVMQNFLNLSGVIGFAVMDGIDRPYFHHLDRQLSEEQQMAIEKGVYHVIQTTPRDCVCFEFYFSDAHIQVHKVTSDLLLLTLLHSSQLAPAYPETLRSFLELLQTDLSATLAALAALASPSTSAIPTPALAEILAAVNHLSQFTTQYLGILVVTNYWRSSRPKVEWLNQFQLDRKGRMSFAGSLSPQESSENRSQESPHLTPEQYQWLQEWVAEFIRQCSQVIRNYPKLVHQVALDEQQKALLLTK